MSGVFWDFLLHLTDEPNLIVANSLYFTLRNMSKYCCILYVFNSDVKIICQQRQ